MTPPRTPLFLTQAVDTLGPGEKTVSPYPVSIGIGHVYLSAPPGTYRIEATLNTVESGPAVSVFVRLSPPPRPD